MYWVVTGHVMSSPLYIWQMYESKVLRELWTLNLKMPLCRKHPTRKIDRQLVQKSLPLPPSRYPSPPLSPSIGLPAPESWFAPPPLPLPPPPLPLLPPPVLALPPFSQGTRALPCVCVCTPWCFFYSGKTSLGDSVAKDSGSGKWFLPKIFAR